MWYRIRAAIKNVWINLSQLRIKRQIDSQLCDSIFAAYVQAWLNVTKHFFKQSTRNKRDVHITLQASHKWQKK